MKITPGCPVFKLFCKVAGITPPEPEPKTKEVPFKEKRHDLDIFREPSRTWIEATIAYRGSRYGK